MSLENSIFVVDIIIKCPLIASAEPSLYPSPASSGQLTALLVTIESILSKE